MKLAMIKIVILFILEGDMNMKVKENKTKNNNVWIQLELCFNDDNMNNNNDDYDCDIKGLNDYSSAELEQMTQSFLKDNDNKLNNNDHKYLDDAYLNKKMNREYKQLDDALLNGYIENKKYKATNDYGYIDLLKAIKNDNSLNKRKKDNMTHEALLDAETSNMDTLQLKVKTKSYYDPVLSIDKDKKRLIQILCNWDSLKSINTNTTAFNEILDIETALHNIDLSDEECFIIHSLYLGYNLNEIAKIMNNHPQNIARKYEKIYQKVKNFC